MTKRIEFAKRVTELLVKTHAILPEIAQGLEEGFSRSSADQFEDFLLDEGFVDRDELLKVLSLYYKVPSIDVVGEFFDSLLLRNFPKEFLARNAVIPLEEENANMLVVVAADPSQDGIEAALRGFTNYDITFLVGVRQDIIDAVEEYYDASVTQEIPEDVDLHEEHRADMEAYAQILQDTEQEYQNEEQRSPEDDIRK